MNNTSPNEWHFDFGLQAMKPDQLIPESKCDELLDVIIAWAEKNDLGIGGGYTTFSEEE